MDLVGILSISESNLTNYISEVYRYVHICVKKNMDPYKDPACKLKRILITTLPAIVPNFRHCLGIGFHMD